MPAKLAPNFAFLHALGGGYVGLAALDARLFVRERDGALSNWLPEVGGDAGAAPVLHGMEGALRDAMAEGAPPLVLPSVRVGGEGAGRVTIIVSWDAASRHFVVVTAPDEGTKALEVLIIQERREKQLLQQQAAAAADRSRISASLYRDIVESTDDAVLRLRPDMSIAFANGPAVRLLGLKGAPAQATPIRQILPIPEAGNPWRPDMCASGQASFEQPFRGASDATAWLWWNVRWLDEADGPGEFQAVGRDITRTRRLRAALDKANEEAKLSMLAQERLRIAHDLHDTLVHSIVNLQARLSLLRRAGGPLSEDFLAAETEAREGLREAREAVGAIRGDLALPDGPGPALEEAVRAFQRRSAANVRLALDPEIADTPPLAAAAMVRIAREALRNAALHSLAGNVDVRLQARPEAFELAITDDGIGFDSRRSHPGHYGLVGLNEQARLARGELSIETAPGAGTRVRLLVPRRED